VTPEPKPTRPSKDLIIALVIFAAALSVRLIYLFQISDTLTFLSPTIDSGTYHSAARRLITDGVMEEPFFWQSFFYPFFLSRFYYFAGPSIVAAKLFGIALGAVTCVLVYFLGKLLSDRTTGAIAAMIVAFYGPLVFFEAELLATGWAAFWSAVLVLLSLKAAKPRTTRPLYLLTGLCAGLAVITRAFFIPFVAASGIWLIWKIWRGGPSYKAALAKISLFVCAAVIIPVLVAGISYLERGTFTALPTSGPVNLYIGNNPNTEHTLTLRPGRQWSQITALPYAHGIEDESKHPAFFMQQFLHYVKTDPGDYLKGLLYKTIQFTGSREIPRNFDVYLNRESSSLLSVLTFKAGRFGFPFGLLLPLAIVGLALNTKRIPAPVFLFLILYPLAVILVFVCARYRTPVIPILAVPAALGIQKAAQFLRQRRFTALCLLISVIIVIAAASSLAGPFGPEKFNYEAEMYYLAAFAPYKNKDYEKADELLSKAIELQPDYADAYILRGTIYSEADQPKLAVEYLSKAIELAPDFYYGRYRLAENLIKLDQPDLAAEQLRIALADSQRQHNHFMSARIRSLSNRVSDPNALRN
jgi:4-amino-4-deoxy-L-arabinose transferase-like glycosyltransferase